MSKITKGFVITACSVVTFAGVAIGIISWKFLLTDKRPYEQRFEECRSTRLEQWIESYQGSNPQEDASKAFEEATTECRAKVDP